MTKTVQIGTQESQKKVIPQELYDKLLSSFHKIKKREKITFKNIAIKCPSTGRNIK